LLAQLLALNQEVAAKIEKGESVTAPGVPKNYPDAKQLMTEDCIVEVNGLARYGKGRDAYYGIRLGCILKIKRWHRI
jgi:hypothetical protein